MSKHLTKTIAPCLAFLLFAIHCSLFTTEAQTATATLSGTVTDANGAAIPAASVTIEDPARGVKRTAETNDSGAFTINLLPPSNYTLTVARDGFASAQVQNVILNVGDQKSIGVELKISPIKDEVIVTPSADLVDIDPSVRTVVDRTFVENIPLNGRSFQSLIALTPGVVITPAPSGLSQGQFSVNGQRASANTFMVDGVSANIGVAPSSNLNVQTGGNLPGLTAFGTTQSLASVDALQEFQVQTSTYSAEFGRQPGGQVSIATRSGTNRFHGSLFNYVRNDIFDANDWFANANRLSRAPLRQNDFGGTVGGPIFFPNFGDEGSRWYTGKDRTFFFFSYEGLRLRLPTFSLSNVPTLCLRGMGSCTGSQSAAAVGIQPILNAFPRPNGRDLGNGWAEFSASYSNPAALDATSLRIDHAITGKMSVFGRYNQVPSETSSRASVNLARPSAQSITTKTLTVGFAAVPFANLTNEFRFNLSDNSGRVITTQDTFGGSSPVGGSVLIPDQYNSGTTSGSANFAIPGLTVTSASVIHTGERVQSQQQINLVDNVTYSHGPHQLKFGLDYRKLMPTYSATSYNSTLIFQTSQAVLAGIANVGTVSAAQEARPIFTNFSLYAQETWKPTARLTLNFGIRWDVNPPAGEADGNLPLAVDQIDDLRTMRLAERSTAQWETTFNNLAPRLGLAYQLTRKPGQELVVRSGFGVFYDTGNDQSAAGFIGFPFSGATIVIQNVSLPLNATQVAPPIIPVLQSNLTPPYASNLELFDPHLKLPYTLQWNVAAERSLGKSQSLSITYVGATGRRLLQRRFLNLAPQNALFRTVNLTTNAATSEYHAFQAQFQRRLTRGLQTLVSYSWSHAIDEDSSSTGFRIARRGNADFDVRHVFSAAVTFQVPSLKGLGSAEVIFKDWFIDSIVHAQSSLPVDVVASTVIDPLTGNQIAVRPNVIPGVPLYLFGSQYPGGRILNNMSPTPEQIAAAGCRPVTASTPAKGAFCTPLAGQSGNLGRNEIRGLPSWQVDLALRREIKLHELVKLQLRAEAFNLFNHPNFGTINTTLSSPTFGQATNMLGRQLGGISQLYQAGGPRSLQFAAKIVF